MAHGLETLVAAAEHSNAVYPEPCFCYWGRCGEGAIEQLTVARGLSNVRFVGQQLREHIPGYIAGADVCLVMLKKTELFKTVIPTKLLNICLREASDRGG